MAQQEAVETMASGLHTVTGSECIAAELSADILEHPRRLEQYERSLVAAVIIVARRRPELTRRAAEMRTA